jgi:hypothetical protein
MACTEGRRVHRGRVGRVPLTTMWCVDWLPHDDAHHACHAATSVDASRRANDEATSQTPIEIRPFNATQQSRREGQLFLCLCLSAGRQLGALTAGIGRVSGANFPQLDQVIILPLLTFAWNDQRQPTFRILPLVQMPRRFRQHHLKGWANVGLQQVATHCGAITSADNDMRMECRLTIRPDSDIANERHNLNLFGHRDLDVILGLPIEDPNTALLSAPIAVICAAASACSRANPSITLTTSSPLGTLLPVCAHAVTTERMKLVWIIVTNIRRITLR